MKPPITQRRWATKYAIRLGPVVNLVTLAGFGIGNLIWIAYDDASPLRRGDQPLVGPLIIMSLVASVIAALVALLLAHLLLSIPPIRKSTHGPATAFEITAIIVVATPVAIGLSLEIHPAFAAAVGVLHFLLILWASGFVLRRIPPYPVDAAD